MTLRHLQRDVLDICAVASSSKTFSWKNLYLSASEPIHNNKSFHKGLSRICWIVFSLLAQELKFWIDVADSIAFSSSFWYFHALYSVQSRNWRVCLMTNQCIVLFQPNLMWVRWIEMSSYHLDSSRHCTTTVLQLPLSSTPPHNTNRLGFQQVNTLKLQGHALKLPTPGATAFSLEIFFINGSFTRILFP